MIPMEMKVFVGLLRKKLENGNRVYLQQPAGHMPITMVETTDEDDTPKVVLWSHHISYSFSEKDITDVMRIENFDGVTVVHRRWRAPTNPEAAKVKEQLDESQQAILPKLMMQAFKRLLTGKAKFYWMRANLKTTYSLNSILHVELHPGVSADMNNGMEIAPAITITFVGEWSPTSKDLVVSPTMDDEWSLAEKEVGGEMATILYRNTEEAENFIERHLDKAPIVK